MVDKNKKSVKVGDFVRYWITLDRGSRPTQLIGKIMEIEDGFAYVAYPSDTTRRMRSNAGIEKLSDSEAMLYLLEW